MILTNAQAFLPQEKVTNRSRISCLSPCTNRVSQCHPWTHPISLQSKREKDPLYPVAKLRDMSTVWIHVYFTIYSDTQMRKFYRHAYIQRLVYIRTYIYIYVYIDIIYKICLFISWLCLLSRPRSTDTLLLMSTPSAQILVSKHHCAIKEIRTLWKRTDYRAGAVKIQDDPMCVKRTHGSIWKNSQ